MFIVQREANIPMGDWHKFYNWIKYVYDCFSLTQRVFPENGSFSYLWTVGWIVLIKWNYSEITVFMTNAVHKWIPYIKDKLQRNGKCVFWIIVNLDKVEHLGLDIFEFSLYINWIN